jgi:hypothetical protein
MKGENCSAVANKVREEASTARNLRCVNETYRDQQRAWERRHCGLKLASADQELHFGAVQSH